MTKAGRSYAAFKVHPLPASTPDLPTTQPPSSMSLLSHSPGPYELMLLSNITAYPVPASTWRRQPILARRCSRHCHNGPYLPIGPLTPGQTLGSCCLLPSPAGRSSRGTFVELVAVAAAAVANHSSFLYLFLHPSVSFRLDGRRRYEPTRFSIRPPPRSNVACCVALRFCSYRCLSVALYVCSLLWQRPSIVQPYSRCVCLSALAPSRMCQPCHYGGGPVVRVCTFFCVPVCTPPHICLSLRSSVC